MCMKSKSFKIEKQMLLCRYTSNRSPVTREVLVSDYTQAFMLMDSLLRNGAIASELDFEFKPVCVVVGGDEK